MNGMYDVNEEVFYINLSFTNNW